MIIDLLILGFDLYRGIIYLIVAAFMSYIISMIVVDFPCTIIEAIIKKQISEEIPNKIKTAITIILTLIISSQIRIR